jgi:acetyl-CoA carboxylase biotin carboxyl carrier protein
MTNTEIQDLIKLVSRSSVSEVEIERKDFKITVKSEGKKKKDGLGEVNTMPMQYAPMAAMPTMAAPMPQVPTAQAPVEAPKAAAETTASDDSNLITVKSPMIGTFYRKPSPDKDAFINVGDDIKVGQTVCIIEAMKLFNEIEAEVSGKVVKVLVDDMSPVEYDQPLFLVEPA